MTPEETVRTKPSVNLRVNYRGKYTGYCNYLRNGDYSAAVHMNAMLEDVMTGCEGHESMKGWHENADGIDRFAVFLIAFWSVYHHELVGHGLGHKFRIRGYSSEKDGHFAWLDHNLTTALFNAWTDRGSVIEVSALFSDVAQWILKKFPVKEDRHDVLTELGFWEIANS